MPEFLLFAWIRVTAEKLLQIHQTPTHRRSANQEAIKPNQPLQDRVWMSNHFVARDEIMNIMGSWRVAWPAEWHQGQHFEETELSKTHDFLGCARIAY